jgi:PAS domain S-box-containing protein
MWGTVYHRKPRISPEMTDPSESSIRVLVVDDDTTLLEIARDFLERAPGFVVEVEQSPFKALEALACRKYDAVVSDYQMPGLDGIMFLKQLRSRGDEIPFILLTGKGREEVAMDALNNGADYYLQKGSEVKPLFAELTNMVRRSVGHRRAGKAIQESEMRYRRLFNSDRDAVLVWRLDDASLVDVNEKACSLLNYSREELLSARKTDLLTPESLTAKDKMRCQLIREGDVALELTFISKPGERIPCLVTANVMEINGIGHAISIVRDLREQRRSDKEAKEREARFHAIFEHSATGIALEDSDRRILECNPAFGRTFHRKCNELRGTIAYDLMDRDGVEDDRIEFEKLMKGELDQYTRENLYRNRDGSPIWANVHFSRLEDDGRNLALAMVEDVTKRRQAEKLQSSLYQISQATVSSQDLHDLYGRLHAILSELMPAKNFFIGLVAEDDEESMAFPYFVDEMDPNPGVVRRSRTTSNYVIRTGKPLFMDKALWAKLIAEGEIVPSGTLPIHWMGAPLNVGKRTIGVMVVQSYIGTVRYSELDLEILMFVSDHVALAIDLKRSEEALKESQRMLSTLMGNLPGMAYRCRDDDEWTMDFISDGCRNITGYAPQDLIGNTLISYNELIHPDDRKMVAEEVRRGIEEGNQFHSEYRLIARDGTVRWLWEQGCPVYDDSGKMVGLEGFITDVTARKKAQENVRLANWKLTLLGDLTRHDVVNRVTMLSGYLELIDNNVKDEKVRRYLEKAILAARSIGEQMEFIREYQGLGVSEPEWFDMDRLASRAISKTDIGGIGISCELGGLSVFADPMIEKVFGNLVENSLKHGIKTSHITISYLKCDDWVEIYFRDDGNGISQDMKQQLFDRNFKHRIGHGMNFIREVLRITGLEIDEIGQPGKGAVFRIKVPAGTYRVQAGMGKTFMNDASVINQERDEKQ